MTITRCIPASVAAVFAVAVPQFLTVAAADSSSSGGVSSAEVGTNRVAANSVAASAQAGIPTEVMERVRGADLLGRKGKQAEALAEYVWCYDEGATHNSSPESVRLFVGLNFGRLAASYAPAQEALQKRRDELEQQFTKGPKRSAGQAVLLSALNSALKDNERTWKLYQQLPEGDLYRRLFAGKAFEFLVEQQRYKEAVTVMTYDDLTAQFHSNISRIDRGTPAITSERGREAMKKAEQIGIVRRTAQSVEVLAGAGDLEGARTLAAKLIGFDGSETAKDALRKALIRAGHENLAQDLPK
jgi:hypothetical protein